MTEEKITSAAAWNKLPAPELPDLAANGAGAKYEVTKLTYYPASKEECLAIGMKADQRDSVTYALPYAVMKIDQEFELCKLPVELTSWVLRAVLVTQRGANPLPATIEFGTVDGKVVASIC